MKISMAAGPYAHLASVGEDRRGDGLEIAYTAIEPGHVFQPMLREQRWDVAEMSLSTAYLLRDRDDPRFVVLPVFPSRAFRHSSLYVPAERAGLGVDGLRGGRIGILRYGMTTGVWVRKLLADQYGLQAQDLRWTVGEDSPHPATIDPEIVGSAGELARMLAGGELDCLISGRTPAAFEDGGARRLFPRFGEQEKAYWQRTRVFPIMHVMIARRSLFEARPDALAALMQRFEDARDVAEQALMNFDISVYPLPWIAASVEEARGLIGGPLWPYGVAPNRTTLEAFGRALAEDGLASRVLAPEDVFAHP